MGLLLNCENMKESIGADMGTAEWVLIDQACPTKEVRELSK